ncbi:MAG: hypothetical protein LAT81_03380 [Oceanicaulis sp.]|nr:hypothetical protein [Oceanicaulis sp.]
MPAHTPGPRPVSELDAHVRLRTLAEIGWTQWLGLREHSRFSLVANGLHHDMEAAAGGASIAPGQSGQTLLRGATDALLSANVKPGDQLALCFGSLKLGVATILRIERVWVEKDKS